MSFQISAAAAKPAPAGARVAVIWSTYDTDITRPLLDGARKAWTDAGGEETALGVFEVPGSFELPQLALAVAQTGQYDAVVAIGCIIRGETTHDEHIARAVVQGLNDASLGTDVPVALGVLTVNTREQALDRAGGPRGNKGAEAMQAAVAMIHAFDAVVAQAEGDH